MVKVKILIKKQKLVGGAGDYKSLDQFEPEQVKMGMQVEMEHTNDPAVASEIVADHLSEDPEYYTKLNKASL